jgi:hypothetical protein
LLLLNKHGQIVTVAMLSHLSHLLNANVTHANKCVPVKARATWCCAVIEVDKLE